MDYSTFDTEAQPRKFSRKKGVVLALALAVLGGGAAVTLVVRRGEQSSLVAGDYCSGGYQYVDCSGDSCWLATATGDTAVNYFKQDHFPPDWVSPFNPMGHYAKGSSDTCDCKSPAAIQWTGAKPGGWDNSCGSDRFHSSYIRSGYGGGTYCWSEVESLLDNGWSGRDSCFFGALCDDGFGVSYGNCASGYTCGHFDNGWGCLVADSPAGYAPNWGS